MEINELITIDDHGMDTFYTVGKNGIIKIEEHKAQGDGDKWYYDVITIDHVLRVFNFKEVIFNK